MELHILEHSLKVASIAKEGIQICTHGLIKLAFLASKTRCKFFSLTETPEDYTIIVDEEGFKELPQSEHISVADATWLALNVVSGGGNASNAQPIGVTKIAKSVIAPLADHNISVFMLSTYQTDFILVSVDKKRADLVNISTATLENVNERERICSFLCILFSSRFPNNVLFTSASGELWKMVRIGGQPLGFDECGIVAQISEPLATADIPAYYISTFKFDHALVPEENIQSVIGALRTKSTAE
ncbi:cytosolic arginine sensor for mTORC1 subunit 2 [Anarrhichthys ocellatus]|uniref:cytosolic arginine sensor for mTORC1 subunit 2 n=1 Tax=Anarrhichthys ocellatus TaxID=433405 RepID=UPI0012EE5862|nr:cytosolic arginine sensor for mTORC1 subunit 2-like [Anarrhichthys ocellatus]